MFREKEKLVFKFVSGATKEDIYSKLLQTLRHLPYCTRQN